MNFVTQTLDAVREKLEVDLSELQTALSGLDFDLLKTDPKAEKFFRLLLLPSLYSKKSRKTWIDMSFENIDQVIKFLEQITPQYISYLMDWYSSNIFTDSDIDLVMGVPNFSLFKETEIIDVDNFLYLDLMEILLNYANEDRQAAASVA